MQARHLALFLAFALLFPVAASADQKSDDAQCRAALRTQDWDTASTYCKSDAQDYAVSAASAKGEDRAIDLWGEGIAMGDVGIAEAQMQHESGSHEAYAAAKAALTEAQHLSHDKTVLDLIDRALYELPQSP